MRVITGTARGVKLATLEGNDVRPTADRVKEAIFSMIQFELEGRQVLDLFAGSGQLGIEALSRGAAGAVFVDQSGDSIAMVRQNLQKTGLDGSAVVVPGGSVEYLSRCRSVFDIALVDPPYGKGLVEEVLPLLIPLMSPQGVILCETAKTDFLPPSAGSFRLVSHRLYGKTAVGVYRNGTGPEL